MNTYLFIMILTSVLVNQGRGFGQCPFGNCRICTSETIVCDGNEVCPKDLPTSVSILSLSGAFDCGSNIDQDFFASLINLKSLFLTNAIYGNVADNAFVKNPNLEYIILSNNDILTLNEGAFNGLDRVVDINLAGNELTKLDTNVFNHLPVLKTLTVNFNKLTNISKGLFAGMTALDSLYLNDNNINVLELGAFEDSKISHVNLANNPITHFNPGVFKNSQIGVLNLMGTLLTSLPEDLLGSVETLFLAGLTNWTCDCSTLPLLDHLQVHEHTSYPMCKESALVGGKSLQDVGDFLRGLCTSTTPTIEKTTTTIGDTTTGLMNTTTNAACTMQATSSFMFAQMLLSGYAVLLMMLH